MRQMSIVLDVERGDIRMIIDDPFISVNIFHIEIKRRVSVALRKVKGSRVMHTTCAKLMGM